MRNRIINLFSKSSTSSLKIGAGLVALVLIASASPALAYPPGQALTVSLNRNQVMVGEEIKVRVNNPAPGLLRVTFGEQVRKQTVTSGQESAVFRFTPRVKAVFQVVATDAVGDKAYAKAYVPYATAPRYADSGVSFFARVARAKPGSPVVVYYNSRTWFTTVKADGTAKISITIKKPMTKIMQIVVGKTVTQRWVSVR